MAQLQKQLLATFMWESRLLVHGGIRAIKHNENLSLCQCPTAILLCPKKVPPCGGKCRNRNHRLLARAPQRINPLWRRTGIVKFQFHVDGPCDGIKSVCLDLPEAKRPVQQLSLLHGRKCIKDHPGIPHGLRVNDESFRQESPELQAPVGWSNKEAFHLTRVVFSRAEGNAAGRFSATRTT